MSRNALEAIAGEVFQALGDDTRRAVLQAVVEDGPLTATQLAARLPVSRQAIGKHLGTLQGIGVVTSEKVGRDVLFSFDRGGLGAATAWIDRVGARWDERLAELDRKLRDRRR